MKSRFTYGMFAGFALACLFFFFFLFFFPNVFRNLTAKSSPNNYPVAVAPASVHYEPEYVADKRPTAYHEDQYVAYVPPTAYHEDEYVAYIPPTGCYEDQYVAYIPPTGYYEDQYVAYVPPTARAEQPGQPAGWDPNLVVYHYGPESPLYYDRSTTPPALV